MHADMESALNPYSAPGGVSPVFLGAPMRPVKNRLTGTGIILLMA